MKKLRETIWYLFLTVVAFALMGFGLYIMSLGGFLYITFGVLFVISGYIIGWSLYRDNWDWPM